MSPVHTTRKFVASGEGVAGIEGDAVLRFCDASCEAMYLACRETLTCPVCRRDRRGKRGEKSGVACPACLDPATKLDPSSPTHRSLGGGIEVSGLCLWCWTLPFTTVAACLDPVSYDELRRRIAADCPSVRYGSGDVGDHGLYCSGECRKPGAAYVSKRRGAGKRSGREAYAGEPGRPLLTERHAHINRVERDCHWCGRDRSVFGAEVDHVVPLVLGGHVANYNEVPSCKGCNAERARVIRGSDAMYWYTQFGNGKEHGSPESHCAGSGV